MKKFVCIFCIPSAAIDEWVKTVSEADRKAQTEKMMADWQAWMAAHASSIVDKGLPLGKTKRVSASGVADARNDLNFYVTVEAESPEAAAAMFAGHPHLQIPTAYVDVIDASRPGM